MTKKAEIAQSKRDYKTLYNTIKKITKTQTRQPGIGIKDAEGRLLYNKEEISVRWRESTVQTSILEQAIQTR